jgi:hypothetical protein
MLLRDIQTILAVAKYLYKIRIFHHANESITPENPDG